ncbi:MAG: hypothetical protein M9931_07225 [Chitinophagales bacterium]|nr:hypothetical protein [Chitinophagales bacterium]
MEEKDEEPKLGKVNYADVKFIEHFLTFFELSDYYQPEYISQPIADNQKHDAISSEAATKLTFEEFVEQYFKMKR